MNKHIWEDILAWFKKGEPFTSKWLFDIMSTYQPPGEPVTFRSIQAALRRMASAGKLNRMVVGGYAVYWRKGGRNEVRKSNPCWNSKDSRRSYARGVPIV